MASSKARELKDRGAPAFLTVGVRRAGLDYRDPIRLDYGGPMGLPPQHTSCRSRHTMHVVSREPEMR